MAASVGALSASNPEHHPAQIVKDIFPKEVSDSLLNRFGEEVSDFFEPENNVRFLHEGKEWKLSFTPNFESNSNKIFSVIARLTEVGQSRGPIMEMQDGNITAAPVPKMGSFFSKVITEGTVQFANIIKGG